MLENLPDVQHLCMHIPDLYLHLQVVEEQRRLIGSEQAILFADFIQSLKAGDIVEGVIGRCTDFGAFVKLGAGKNFRGVQVGDRNHCSFSQCLHRITRVLMRPGSNPEAL